MIAAAFLSPLSLVASSAQAATTPAPAANSDFGANPQPGNSDFGANSQSSGKTLVNPLKNINSLPDLLYAILHAITQLGIIVLTMAIIWVGFLFIKAQGVPAELAKARQALMWTLIGGVVLLGAEAIGKVIQATATNL